MMVCVTRISFENNPAGQREPSPATCAAKGNS
jgi:hypothetical protein